MKNPPDLVPDTSSGDESDDEESLTMSPAEIRVVRRLATRMNVLPVVAKADSLTDEKLAAVKVALRHGLYEAGLDFGVFGPPSRKKTPDTATTPKRRTKFANGSPAKDIDASHDGETNGINGTDEATPEEEEEERQSRPVIKLRPSRHNSGRALSRSRSRRDLSQAADDERRPVSPDATDTESVANVRFSAHIVAKTDLSHTLPFALIAPEMKKSKHRHRSSDSAVLSTAPSSPINQSEDGHATPSDTEPPLSAVSGRLPYLSGPPDDLKGVFTRKFRWGTIDVLDPNHCDFAALRTAVFSTHIKVSSLNCLHAEMLTAGRCLAPENKYEGSLVREVSHREAAGSSCHPTDIGRGTAAPVRR